MYPNNITIGGLCISNSDAPGAHLEFKFPSDLPISYLLDEAVATALVHAVERVHGLLTLASVGSTDVCISYDKLSAAIDSLELGDEYGNTVVSKQNLRELRKIVTSWREVPISEASLWWNRPPFDFGVQSW